LTQKQNKPNKPDKLERPKRPTLSRVKVRSQSYLFSLELSL
jgi:hypothetical protein